MSEKEQIARREGCQAQAHPWIVQSAGVGVWGTEASTTSATIDAAVLGGKAATLARLSAAGLSVPAWLVVTPAALAASLSPETYDRLTAAGDEMAAAAILAELTLAGDVRAALADALQRLSPDGEPVAVRSSMVAEDGQQHSFAGQFESFLNVSPDTTAADGVAAKVVAVWRAAFAPQVYAYRRERGIAAQPVVPAVLIQRMVQADAAGIAFSADPVSGRRGVAVVAAVRGLGDELAAGHATGDTWQVDRQGKVTPDVIEDAAAPVLDAATVGEVAALARRCAAHFARPQDIEWAVEDGRLWLLQSRPITTLVGMADPDGSATIWDNSNIVESYGGMTTPLTYSFARRAYQEVYQELCRILGVRRSVIQQQQVVFANLVGYVRGRIYYNLLNWYRILALLPGFKANRHFMEQMMGVKESLPESIVADLAAATWRERLRDRVDLARTVVGLMAAAAGLERRKARFLVRLRQALGDETPDFSLWRADELVAYYRRLESDLLPHWDAPLVNDFFAMIFYGVLRWLTMAWCGDEQGTLHNDLLTGQGEMISAEPAQRVREMAALARRADADDPKFSTRLRSGTLAETTAALEQHLDFAAAYHAYLARFGERCLNELKLESATLHDNPMPLLRAVGQVALEPGDAIVDTTADAAAQARSAPARAAEAQVAAALANKPLRRRLFAWVLDQARRRVRDRENLRFERTRVFGRARRILRALGERLYAADALDDPADVFMLEAGEVCGWVEGTATCADLRGLVAVRRRQLAAWADLPEPPPRFVTYGALYATDTLEGTGPAHADQAVIEGEMVTAVGASPGTVRGRARVVHDPLTAALEPGDIVVADHTDPSWIMILPLASALVVVRGSLLSHAAIVARELNVPAVVGVSGAMTWLRDGDWIEVDGRAGTVRRLSPDEVHTG